ncbi:TIGR02452 family protein [Nocardia neocaledoniensis]|uniref:TIGR02452 family protein n=1 Tax=Nocardia neocaledoniensis TaxID=236511 RepID=UPI0024559E92|nr:TIGR02452 family protein [Nocardia neocaledoniensis]
MSTRRHHVAVVNEEIATGGTYVTDDGTTVDVRADVAAARAGTVSYAPPRLARMVGTAPPHGEPPEIEVTGEGSVTAARRLFQDGAREPIGVLNFASARNPGGGYLGGARAQEEDLCRSALLYTCLLEAPDYYAAHRASADLAYSHRVVVSPGVPVIRDDHGALAAPFPVTFLTSPAPNAGELARRSARVDVRTILSERAERVIAVAAHHGVRTLVLGAWGCGVFGNDPAHVADAFDAALRTWGPAFDRVVFAVRDRSATSPNRAAFEARFSG